jgi:hypothetical protein
MKCEVRFMGVSRMSNVEIENTWGIIETQKSRIESRENRSIAIMRRSLQFIYLRRLKEGVDSLGRWCVVVRCPLAS